MERADIMRLAAESGLDARTVKRATESGVGALRAAVDRERLRAAASKLGIEIDGGVKQPARKAPKKRKP